ncbi:hypothetical protein SISSUDRAFT_1045421 [Sistotremastrum suecicum HHB10207 ss-3]|uniref:F-box domain-containing protein n=1 Tax=Sistotremastrum suecicum HHB10207 ss-3 TaxID=1314776 RepID=A0A166EFY1_9AGAM|nr:hypothetical protein SISSUDRAFT_1045421 [Sistotremastrum suecicum HHB10207 ss-3]
MVAPSLDNLAVELVVEILKGEDIQTIVSVGLTSSRLYRIVRNERKIWTKASDILDLPLQTGETLPTIPTPMIISRGMRAVSIRKRLEDDEPVPLRFLKVHELGSEIGDFKWRLLPGGQWLLLQDDHDIRLFSANSRPVISDSTPIFSAESIYRCMFEAIGNREMRLAVQCTEERFGLKRRPRLVIIHLRFPLQLEDMPIVISIKSYPLPDRVRTLFLNEGIVSVYYHELDNTFSGILFDCGTELGVRIAAEPLLEVVKATNGEWHWQSLDVKPKLRKCVLFAVCVKTGQGSTLRLNLLADIPSLCHPFSNTSDSKNPTLFQCDPEMLRVTHLHVENDPFSSNPPLSSRYVPIKEYIAPDSWGVVCLCLDTESGVDGELVAFSMRKSSPDQDSFTLCWSHSAYCTRGVIRWAAPRLSQSRVLLEYVDEAYGRASSLKLTLPREVSEDSSKVCEIKQIEFIQGQILLTAETAFRDTRVSMESHDLATPLHTTWLLQY